MRGRPLGSWTSSLYRWSPMDAWLPGGLPELDTDDAAAELVRRWLRAFGPGTYADLKWWTGWPAALLRRALAQVGAGRGRARRRRDRARAGRRRASRSAAPDEPWVALLPALDPAPMGWQERGWYLGEHRERLFDRSGNIGPTVWCDGRIVGGWAQRRTARSRSRCSRTRAPTPAAAIAAEAAAPARLDRRRARHAALSHAAGARAVGDLTGRCAARAVGGPGRRRARMRHDARAMAPVEVRDLSKRFGNVEAVKNLSFDVQAGRVTGFLGPNGAGKTTTLRALLGLIHPTAGTARSTAGATRSSSIRARRSAPCSRTPSFHPGRSARNHLRVLAATGEHPPERVEQVLDAVGLTPAADRRVKGYSMGMRQRLAIAAALLGDPEVLILDEPTNGLDPPGIAWMRSMVREQAGARARRADLQPPARRGRAVRRRRDRHRARRAARAGHARAGARRRRRPGDGGRRARIPARSPRALRGRRARRPSRGRRR